MSASKGHNPHRAAAPNWSKVTRYGRRLRGPCVVRDFPSRSQMPKRLSMNAAIAASMSAFCGSGQLLYNVTVEAHFTGLTFLL
jgi:hypothetical protein